MPNEKIIGTDVREVTMAYFKVLSRQVFRGSE
jgi:hypothetical protein